MNDTTKTKPLAPAPGSADPDLGPISRGHVCKHGVRWPHECKPCADAAYERFVEESAKHCCCRANNNPCDGVLAGGPCDMVQEEQPIPYYDDDDDTWPNARADLPPASDASRDSGTAMRSGG